MRLSPVNCLPSWSTITNFYPDGKKEWEIACYKLKPKKRLHVKAVVHSKGEFVRTCRGRVTPSSSKLNGTQALDASGIFVNKTSPGLCLVEQVPRQAVGCLSTCAVVETSSRRQRHPDLSWQTVLCSKCTVTPAKSWKKWSVADVMGQTASYTEHKLHCYLQGILTNETFFKNFNATMSI